MGNCPATKQLDEQKREDSKKGPITFKYHQNTCALEYYEPVQALAEGSISTIYLVRRRKERVDIPYKERGNISLYLNPETNGVSPLIEQEDESKDGENKLQNGTSSPEENSAQNSNIYCDTPRKENESSREQLYVLKSIMKGYVKNDAYLDEMRDEINMMKYLDHPNIAKVYEAFEKKRHVYLIMEYLEGGDLADRFPYSEYEAANIIRQVLRGVAYLHRKNIVHRDIKLENCVFESKNSEKVKIIDFGLATRYLSKAYKKLTDKVGTLYTMAPQQIQGMYTEACDLWSVGVVTYCLLSGGEMPFYGSTRKKVIDRIMRCDYDFKGSAWKYVSPEAKEFVSSLLVMEPSKRPSAAAALKSKWMTKTQPSDSRKLEKSEAKEVCNVLHSYSQERELKKLALLIIAHQTSSQEIDKLTRLFISADKNGDGVISLQEFRKLLLGVSMTKEELNAMFRKLDVGHDGFVRYTEFIAAMLEAQGRIDKEKIAMAFDMLDSDSSGEITKSNLRDLLAQQGHKISESRLDEIFQEVGPGKCCAVSKEEFLQLFDEKKIDLIRKSSCPCMVESDTDDLVGEDAIIPGGKYCDHPSESPCQHIYDEKTKSMRRYESFKREQNSVCCEN